MCANFFYFQNCCRCPFCSHLLSLGVTKLQFVIFSRCRASNEGSCYSGTANPRLNSEQTFSGLVCVCVFFFFNKLRPFYYLFVQLITCLDDHNQTTRLVTCKALQRLLVSCKDTFNGNVFLFSVTLVMCQSD